jgi:hypothetical protein
MDTINDIISGLKWGDLDPIEAHARICLLYNFDYCIEQTVSRISLEFVEVAKKNDGKLINEIPEALKMLELIESLDKYRTN